jgi:hypothetical protein
MASAGLSTTVSIQSAPFTCARACASFHFVANLSLLRIFKIITRTLGRAGSSARFMLGQPMQHPVLPPMRQSRLKARKPQEEELPGLPLEICLTVYFPPAYKIETTPPAPIRESRRLHRQFRVTTSQVQSQSENLTTQTLQCFHRAEVAKQSRIIDIRMVSA